MARICGAVGARHLGDGALTLCRSQHGARLRSDEPRTVIVNGPDVLCNVYRQACAFIGALHATMVPETAVTDLREAHPHDWQQEPPPVVGGLIQGVTHLLELPPKRVMG